jgi:group I intron endonuclease
MISGIYKITNPKGYIYIGQSIILEKRKKDYQKLRIKQQPKIFNSISKYSWNNHIWEEIEYCSVEYLNEKETYWKQYYLDKVEGDWSKVLFCDLHDQGTGPKSEETKQKISKSKLGIPLNHGYKISESLKGRIHSDETLSKMKKPRSKNAKQNMNKPKSKNHIINISKGLKKPVLQYDLQGNFIKEWNGSIDANKELNININSCLRGLAKTSGGFIWRRKTDPLTLDIDLKKYLTKKDKGIKKNQPKQQGINISKALKGRKITWNTKKLNKNIVS